MNNVFKKHKIDSLELFKRNVFLNAFQNEIRIFKFKNFNPISKEEISLINELKTLDDKDFFIDYILYYSIYKFKNIKKNYDLYFKNSDFMFYFLIELNFLYVFKVFTADYLIEHPLVQDIKSLSEEYSNISESLINIANGLDLNNLYFCDNDIFFNFFNLLKKNNIKARINNFYKRFNKIDDNSFSKYNNIFDVIEKTLILNHPDIKTFINKNDNTDAESLVFIHYPEFIYFQNSFNVENIVPKFLLNISSESNRKYYSLLCSISLFYKDPINKDFLRNLYLKIGLTKNLFNNDESTFENFSKLDLNNKLIEEFNFQVAKKPSFSKIFFNSFNLKQEYKDDESEILKEDIQKFIFTLSRELYFNQDISFICPTNKSFSEDFEIKLTKLFKTLYDKRLKNE